MNTNQLLKCIRTDRFLNNQCVGVYPLDKIPEIEGFPECMILNLDPSKKPGSHWVALHFNQEGFGEFFDSYGQSPKKRPIVKTLKQNSCDWTYNQKLLQSPYSSTCGQYCIYYLYHRVRGFQLSEIVNSFGSDLEQNDTYVTEWVNNTFDVNTDVFELEFMINQICRALLKK